jgi:rubrerythrin
MARMLKEVIALLNRLIQLDYDAIEAHKSAISRLSDPADRAQLGAFVVDHRRHVDELAFIVRNLGGEPASYGDLRHAIGRGKVVLGGLLGSRAPALVGSRSPSTASDRAVLEAMRGNEAESGPHYESAASQPGIPVDILAVLERTCADERRHQAWFASRLDRSDAWSRGTGPNDPPRDQ